MKSNDSLIIKSAFAVANKIDADAVFVHVDPLSDMIFEERVAKKSKLVLVTKKKRLDTNEKNKKSLLSLAKAVITIPKIQSTRMTLIKIATTLALSQDIIEPGVKVVFAAGGSDTGSLDMIQVVDTSKESEFLSGKGIAKIAESVPPELFESVLNITVELADKGREGKAIGTIFVLGDHEKVMQLSKQMIMNPFKGYDEEERNILSPSLKETIRELSAMDGAFVIADDGTVLTAGRYLGAATDESSLPRGLGSRHIAAAGITSLTQSIAFVISESSGDVRIFKDGRIITHIEKAPSKK
ncbi:MAG: hypothetical protein HN337_06685 [Deltaproteobacteria bacterium]|jgi:diadenylate cyclase|nr:hypothetical protein [Deltaproteobacteria bacterium]